MFLNEGAMMKTTYLLLAILAVVAGCGGDSPSGPTVESVAVTPQLTVLGADAFYDAGDDPAAVVAKLETLVGR